MLYKIVFKPCKPLHYIQFMSVLGNRVYIFCEIFGSPKIIIQDPPLGAEVRTLDAPFIHLEKGEF